jgi:hypothetical protein
LSVLLRKNHYQPYLTRYIHLLQALATGFTFSADTVEKAFQTDPKYAEKLRLFMYGGMQFDPAIASNDPKYVTSTQSFAEDPLLGRWHNAGDAAALPFSLPSLAVPLP